MKYVSAELYRLLYYKKQKYNYILDYILKTCEGWKKIFKNFDTFLQVLEGERKKYKVA